MPHVARDYLRAGPSRILGTLRDALRDRIEDKLPSVRVPVTFLCGARDPVAPPAWGKQLAKLTGSRAGLGESRLVVVPGAAHAAPFSHPAAIAAEILATVTRLEGSRLSRSLVSIPPIEGSATGSDSLLDGTGHRPL